MTAVRISLVLLAFLPFAWYAGRDAIFHFRGRQVSLPEHMLHLVIGLGIFVVLVQALLGSLLLLLVGLCVFLVGGCLDEFWYHQDLPIEETDLHAKEHMALLLFLGVSLFLQWLDAHAWRLPSDELLSVCT